MQRNTEGDKDIYNNIIDEITEENILLNYNKLFIEFWEYIYLWLFSFLYLVMEITKENIK